jgi:hypothetical protein
MPSMIGRSESCVTRSSRPSKRLLYRPRVHCLTHKRDRHPRQDGESDGAVSSGASVTARLRSSHMSSSTDSMASTSACVGDGPRVR